MFPAVLPNKLNEFIFIVIITILVVRVEVCVVSKGIHKMAVALLRTSCNLLQAPAESREVREDALSPPVFVLILSGHRVLDFVVLKCGRRQTEMCEHCGM